MRIFMPRLILQNDSETDVDLSLNKQVSCGQTTLRKNRFRLTPCHIKAGGYIDVCVLLEMDVASAREVVESSHDYKMLHLHRHLHLVDLDETLAKWQAGEHPPVVESEPWEEPYESRRSTRGAHLPPELDEFGEPIPGVPQTNSARARASAALPKASPDDPTTTPVIDAAEPAAAGALDPGIRAALADSIPTTKWDKTKLLEYARAKGLTIPDDMSKNSILRKLRGL